MKALNVLKGPMARKRLIENNGNVESKFYCNTDTTSLLTNLAPAALHHRPHTINVPLVVHHRRIKKIGNLIFSPATTLHYLLFPIFVHLLWI